ncbi:MAG TPA: response regulator [Planctomycetaceae bacterium]|nr:response regulator [Planctomycetaceae bacterium]
MSERPPILVLGAEEPGALSEDLRDRFGTQFELVRWSPSNQWPETPPTEDYRCVVLCGSQSHHVPELLQLDGILRHLPQGIAVVDPEFRVRWSNDRLAAIIGRPLVINENFFEAFGSPETIGPEFAPFHPTEVLDDTCSTTLRAGEKTYFEIVGAPVYGADHFPQLAVVTVRDVSSDMIVRQKLKAIYQAGLELGELSAEDVVELSAEDRIELLKQKIVQFTQDVLEFNTIEIRLLDKQTNELTSLLQVGMSPEAASRQLFASETGNGVTGYVAATGQSYLCEDTSHDPRYLQGAEGARSSLTVPLMLHDQILGTFNCESAQVHGFGHNDLQFLELFCREVAIALNTLELLVAEKLATTTESTDLILKEMAQPIDEILNDTAWILERYIGHDPSVCERLQRVLKHTRSVRQLVHRVGETIAPKIQNAPVALRSARPKLRQKRVLVVDNDESVRIAAHELLGRFGCEVETAHHGEEALLMVRSFHYDAVILDIRLPDMTGYDCFVGVRQLSEHLPVILMTGFGYDPAHSIVKARQAGLKSVLYKPFRLDQLLKEVETAVGGPDEASA